MGLLAHAKTPIDEISVNEEQIWGMCRLTTHDLLKIAQQNNCHDCGMSLKWRLLCFLSLNKSFHEEQMVR